MPFSPESGFPNHVWRPSRVYGKYSNQSSIPIDQVFQSTKIRNPITNCPKGNVQPCEAFELQVKMYHVAFALCNKI
jgi:hypothetical protein